MPVPEYIGEQHNLSFSLYLSVDRNVLIYVYGICIKQYARWPKLMHRATNEGNDGWEWGAGGGGVEGKLFDSTVVIRKGTCGEADQKRQ